MNKDFEKAYKELAETKVPDLWDRIDKGLSERSAPVKRKFPVFSFGRRYAALAAAVVCVMIIIPALTVLKGSYLGSSGSDSKAAAKDDMEAAGIDTYAETTEESAVDAGSFEYEQELSYAEAAEDSMPDHAGVQEKEETLEDCTEELEKTETARESLSSITLYEVTLKVLESEDITEETDIEKTGTLYTAEIQTDPSGTLKPGEKVDIFIPVYSSIAFMENSVYLLDIAREAEDEERYVITKYHSQIVE